MTSNIDIEKTIKVLKIKIQKAKDELSDAKAQKKLLLSTLKKDFNLENILEAETEVTKLEKETNKLLIQMEEKYNELKGKLDI